MSKDKLSAVESTADDVAWLKSLEGTDKILAKLLDATAQSNPFLDRNDVVSKVSAEHLATRTLYFNREVSRFIDEHASSDIQVIVVASGLDTRAYQQENYPKGKQVRFFEVDLPAFSARKQNLLKLAEIDKGQTHYITHNITEFGIANKLKSCGFDMNKATLVTIEGISMYLPKAKFKAFLAEIIQIQANQIILDWFPQSVIDMDKDQCGGLADLAKRFADKDAKWTTAYSSDEIAGYLNKTVYPSDSLQIQHTQRQEQWATYQRELSCYKFGIFK